MYRWRDETTTLHWRAAKLGKVHPLTKSEVRSVMTGRYEEFFSHVWGHYHGLDARHRRS